MFSHNKVLNTQTLDLAARILQNLPKLSEEQVQELIGSPKKLKYLLSYLDGNDRNFQTFTVYVDGSLPFNDMLLKSDALTCVDTEISENKFPIQDTEKRCVTVTLVPMEFSQSNDIDVLVSKMHTHGYRLAFTEEYCSLFSQYPDVTNQQTPRTIFGVTYPDDLGEYHENIHLMKLEYLNKTFCVRMV